MGACPRRAGLISRIGELRQNVGSNELWAWLTGTALRTLQPPCKSNVRGGDVALEYRPLSNLEKIQKKKTYL